MASTCKPWREGMADGLCRRRPMPSIWLLVPHQSEEEDDDLLFEFPSFSEGMTRSYFFTMPSVKARVIGTSRGWLLLEDDLTRLQAFHPLTKTRVVFPFSGSRHREIKKVVFLHRGGDQRPPVLALLRRYEPELAFAAAGDDVWTDLWSPAGSHLDDIVAHDGKLYVLRDQNQVLVFDVAGEQSSSSLAMMIEVEPDYHPYQAKYLGVISGQLILLRWWICTACPFRRRRCVPDFEVLRLLTGHGSQPSWEQVKDLAGHAILLGNDGMVAVPAGDFWELKADCIYSVACDKTYGEAGLTAMSVASRAVGYQPLSTISSFSPLFWFLPNGEV